MPTFIEWTKLSGCAKAEAIAAFARAQSNLVCVVTPDSLSQQILLSELPVFISADQQLPIFNFPDWETLPYDHFAPHAQIVSDRLKTLSQLLLNPRGILLTSISTFMQKISPKSFIAQQALQLKTNQKLDREHFKKTLIDAGYHAVTQVAEQSEFAFRGSLIDIFPMGHHTPYRIDLFDEEIDSLRTFDIETQRSTEKVDAMTLLPAHEFPWTEEARESFCERFSQYFSANPFQCPLYQSVSTGHYHAGLEYYLPFFFDQLATLFDYCPATTTFLTFKENANKAGDFFQTIQNRFEQQSHDMTRPLCKPADLFLTPTQLQTKLAAYPNIEITDTPTTKDARSFETKLPRDLSLAKQTQDPLAPLRDWTQETQDRFLFCAETLGRKEILINLLRGIAIEPKTVHHFSEAIENPARYQIGIFPFYEGAHFHDRHLIVLTENELFGKRVFQRRTRTRTTFSPDEAIRNLAELDIGDPIVHLTHGVGRFRGLQALTIREQTDEYVVIEYARADKIYVPISALHLLSRYSGTQKENAPLHQLGSSQWEKAKQKAMAQLHEVATELLEINAKRQAETRPTLTIPTIEYAAFAENFPFEETPDQKKAIEAVLADLQQSKPMDRLICGDVGFGKTEVAMRAAFVAALNKKQIAVLVPTTLLAQQHTETFQNRFASWKIKIEMLSRFKTPKEQKKILEKIKTGEIDIIIGTHRLLQQDVAFNHLGLLIVDEEHRLGVRHKERIKALRTHIDILTLTATPIPRTLHMAFSGLRDLSLIATPPEHRLSIKTFITPYQQNIIREAILREILRGGQVYFLHNEVATIERAAKQLQSLLPQLKIGVAHGQMPERELERIMFQFYHRQFQVLMCSTIIESGIDIPSANTILIERADKFGLAQLHQLRGRVGRSHHQAYAYLLLPAQQKISADAEKRLDALASIEDLGMGFTLATYDMEIRGAGELLGEAQSGQMEEIGFSLYLDLLEKTVHALKTHQTIDWKKPFEAEIEINIHSPALIPETYLSDPHTRLILYKRIASAKTSAALDDLKIELIDRFGLLPEPTQHLFELAALKLQAMSLGIKRIDVHADHASIEFNEKPNINPDHILKMIRESNKKIQFMGPQKLKFFHKMATANEKLEWMNMQILAFK